MSRHDSHSWRKGVCDWCAARVEWPAGRAPCPMARRGRPDLVERHTAHWPRVGRAPGKGGPDLFAWEGEELTMRQLSERAGISLRVLRERRARGWSLDEAMRWAVQPRDVGGGVTASVHLDADTHNRLTAAAEARGTTLSDLLRRAARAWADTRLTDEDIDTAEAAE